VPQREFLGWKRPLLELAADWLWQRRDELPHLLVVVPTAQSGRLLREALAERGACLAPRVVTPDSFFKVGPAPGIATPLEERFAWIDALRRLGDEEMPALFPVDPVERTFNWAAGVSDQLLATWDALAEGSRNFEDARRESPEPERWQDIARLHRRAVKLLSRWGKQSRPDAKLLAAQRPALPTGSRELVIIGVPEPAPLAILAWDKLAEDDTPIRVLIHAPKERSEAFDSWGRPLADIWTVEPVAIARERIHLVAGAPELSKQVVALCSGKHSDEVTVSLCDAAFGPAIEAAFSEAGWPAWNPEGKAAGRALANLLRGLAALGRETPPTWQQITSILRNPLLAAILGPKDFFSALERLDQLEKDRLPESLERLQWLLRGSSQSLSGVRRLSEIIEWLDGWRSRFAALPAATVIQQWVAEMRHRSVDDGADGGLYQLLEAATPDLTLLERESRLDDPGDAVELALTGSESLRSIRGREEAVLDLPGWLELSFEKAPTLILAGMHDGAVPDGRMDDAFLPDGVRVRLELRSATTRHARDAFLLHSFAESREVQVVVAKVDPQGEPRRPSRLLLAASGVDLAQRVQQLAGKPPASANRLSAWSRGEWKLDFSEAARGYLDGDRKLSPSAFRDYLHCPFRFYLRRLLKWDRYEADKMEMSPRDFGTICHAAFEAMGRDATMRETTNQKELAEFLVTTLDHALKERFETPLSLPLMVQREAAAARLERFAEIEVADRMDGWSIVDVEVAVGSEQRPWSFEGQPVSMQIDRIDIHPKLGMRVLDYKSSAKADSPEAAHLRTLSERRRTFGPTLIAASGRSREKVWKNIQLPLYAAYVKEHYSLSHAPAVGYVNLPATVNDIGISMWHDFDNATMDNALEWTRGAIAGMKAGLHWPPVELTGAEARMDDFADLAPDGFESAVSGSLIEQFKAAAEAYDLERSTP
jgi:ATP-dependent helicase/nuclease subunit B